VKFSDRYYTGREVQRKLGITEPALRNLVQQKRLRKVYPPGRKTGLYLKTDVDTFVEKWEAFLMSREPPRVTFDLARLEDMEAENELDRRAVGGAGMTAEVRQAWLAVNPECDYHVKYDNKLVAFLRLLPLKQKMLDAFINGEIRGREIPALEVETFEPGKPVDCLVIGVASEPDVNEISRTHYMLVLLRGTAKELRKLGQRHIIIRKIYATSESPTGIAMAMHVGMQELPPRLGKRLRFVLSVEQSPSFLASAYREGLEERQKNTEREP